ncbi:Hsp20/alpha crystallin family protein [Paraliobacillus sediminis]|uniref:Hsp20/alpha crystallin family protein n=1 Tax=Paraliobacillus sediminis TaxID=1885916 RepID=UPI000E3BE9FB|nr:Hsp20/alpha crystallin family protein [Paraliobacillus sediminis]
MEDKSSNKKATDFFETGQEFIRKMDGLFADRPKNNMLDSIDAFFQKNGLTRLPVDVFENEKEWIVQADLPGLRKEDIHIDVIGDRLKIKIKHDEMNEKKDDKKAYYHRERRYQQAERTVQLPYVIDKRTTKAGYKNGVLEVRGPKKAKTDHIIDID